MREGIALRRPALVDGVGGPWTYQAVLIGDRRADRGAATAPRVAETSTATGVVGDFPDAALRACKILATQDAGEAL
jgi:hypothetical protein